MTPTEKERIKKKKIAEQVERATGKGINAARIFLVARMKETLNVPAPKVKVKGGGWRAITPATAGAPPRKLSGNLQRSVTSKMLNKTTAIIGVNAKSKDGFNYPKYLDQKSAGNSRSGEHPFTQPTMNQWIRELTRIAGFPVILRKKG